MKQRQRMYEPEPPGSQPPYGFDAYKSTLLRAPQRTRVHIQPTLSEICGAAFSSGWAGADQADLTTTPTGEALGQRIIVAGRLLDEDGRPVRRSLVEIWQANAAGRYRHDGDQHDAPLDPNFIGGGYALTNDEGGFRFLTIKPGAYPWRNHDNAWRPAHIHFSVFGRAYASRLITQMYFPGDPLLPLDPIFNSVPDSTARNRLVSQYAHDLSEPEYALGYRFDIVVRGRESTPMVD